MNLWECDHPGCGSQAVGMGGGIGLQAIGWTFHSGGLLLCPAHGETMPCYQRKNPGGPCALCAGDARAIFWQTFMRSDPVSRETEPGKTVQTWRGVWDAQTGQEISMERVDIPPGE